MEPELGAVVAIGISGGIAIVKIFERFWPQNGNGKIEMLLSQLVELAKEDRDRSVEQVEIQRTTLREMERHDRNANKMTEDILKLLRKE